ncbi:Fasciclin-like arabinogalactan protein 2 [Acorus calamus]|uniref:Fasciclin-like arabinogalactan protein 2 n=1 Tax=Acorus calamus TaxID=4465 RepID=A0AAV9D8S1_ACOCL|nr:Fasciclin-like arabinogalactan protein 2 [Acorus calamus]
MQAMKNHHLHHLLLLLLLFMAATTTTTNAADTPGTHNITKILAKYPEFSTFNPLPDGDAPGGGDQPEADHNGPRRRQFWHGFAAIETSLAVHDKERVVPARPRRLLRRQEASPDHSWHRPRLLHATGAAPGTTGFVNITDLKAGHVGFGAQDSGTLDSRFVKSVVEHPYKISVIQAPDVEKTFEGEIDTGLTIFCPVDTAVTAFMHKFKNLTKDEQSSLLMYHGTAVYNSFSMLKMNNGIMNTLATDTTTKNHQYKYTIQDHGETITLKTKIVSATVTGTLFDEQPLAIYIINKVLEPRELFKVPEVDALAPAPATKDRSASSTADESDGSSDDDKAANTSGAEEVRRIRAAVVVVMAVVLAMAI